MRNSSAFVSSISEQLLSGNYSIERLLAPLITNKQLWSPRSGSYGSDGFHRRTANTSLTSRFLFWTWCAFAPKAQPLCARWFYLCIWGTYIVARAGLCRAKRCDILVVVGTLAYNRVSKDGDQTQTVLEYSIPLFQPRASLLESWKSIAFFFKVRCKLKYGRIPGSFLFLNSCFPVCATNQDFYSCYAVWKFCAKVPFYCRSSCTCYYLVERLTKILSSSSNLSIQRLCREYASDYHSICW